MVNCSISGCTFATDVPYRMANHFAQSKDNSLKTHGITLFKTLIARVGDMDMLLIHMTTYPRILVPALVIPMLLLQSFQLQLECSSFSSSQHRPAPLGGKRVRIVGHRYDGLAQLANNDVLGEMRRFEAGRDYLLGILLNRITNYYSKLAGTTSG
ncbi:hypothetical protein Tco_0559127 [Tanacetum coccineum]